MDTEELLMSTCESSKPFAVNLWDWKTTNLVFHYKNGGPISPNLVGEIGNDYIIGGNTKEPKLYLWQLNNQDPLKKFRLILPEVATCLTICPNNCYLATGIKTDLYIWQLNSGKLLTIQKKNYQPITVIQFASCGKYLLVGGQDGLLNTYRLVDLVSLDKSFLPQSIVGQTEPMYTRDHHNHPITGIHIGNFGIKSRFATCSIDQTVKIYELLNGKLLLNLVFQNPVYSITFDSSGWNLFVGCSNGVLQTFSLTDPPSGMNHHVSLQEVEQKNLLFKGHTKSVKCICLNVSGSVLASGADDGLIFIWEVSSRQALKKIEQNSPITNLKFKLNHLNIRSQNFKLSTVLKDLEMQLNLNDKNFGITLVQCVDIKDQDKQLIKPQKLAKQQFWTENVELRARNQQLYNYCLELLTNIT